MRSRDMTLIGPRKFRFKAAQDRPHRYNTTGNQLPIGVFGAPKETPKPAIGSHRYRTGYLRDKNPLVKSSLRLRDIHPGTRFVCHSEWHGVWATGTFLSYPTAHPSATSRMKWTGLWVCVRLDGIGLRLVELTSLGIIPDANGNWSDYLTVVSPRKRSLLPDRFDASAKDAARLVASMTLPICWREL